MRKVLTSIVLVLVCFLFAAVSLAEGEIGITAETLDASEGEDVTVSVNLTSCLGMDSLQFNLNYDAASFRFVTADGGELLSDGLFVFNPDEDGVVRFAFACADGLKNDSGTAFTVTFNALNEYGTALTITDALATRYDSGTQEQSKAYLTLENGGIAVGSEVPEAKITPWIPETPTPAPTFTPEPEVTAEPTAAPLETAETTPEPEVPVQKDFRAYLPYIAIGLGVLIIILIVLIVIQRKRDD